MNPRLTRRIMTSNPRPPVPSRDYDWSAVFEGYEPGESIGHGATEQEAIDWLIAEEAHLIATEHSKEYECTCEGWLRPECDGVGCAADRANAAKQTREAA